MTAFLFTQNEVGLFTVAAAFGLGFSGIIPAYVLALREMFPASEASWRIPTLLLFSGAGMALGGWLAGLLYDHYGYYAPAFATGIGANLLNLMVVGALVARQRLRRREALADQAARGEARASAEQDAARMPMAISAGTIASQRAGRGQRRGAGPGDRRKRLRRRSRCATTSAGGGTGCASPACGTRAGSRWRRRPRRGCRRRDHGGTRRSEGERRDERREDDRDGAHHRFDLGAHDRARRRPARWRPDRARPRRRSRARRARRASCPAAMTSTGTSTTSAPVPSPKAAPQQQRRRQQVEDLHQRLRHQPGIAPQQRPFLAPQHARCGERRRKACDQRRWRTTALRNAGGRNRMIAEARPRTARSRRRAAATPSASDGDQRAGIAEHGARRPPERRCRRRARCASSQSDCSDVEARQAAVGEDRGDLQADDEGRADHRRDDLRDEPRALRADGAEQRDGERDRERRRRRAHRGDHAIGAEPARRRRARPAR